jgi:hypothetical protein
MDTWVPLSTLHCTDIAQTWWRSLRTPANFLHWTQFCTMVSNRFSLHSAHNSIEHFHHLKQTSSVADYIQIFEELMAMVQLDYPGFNKSYFVSSFIAGLKEGIKHYHIPHAPQTLCYTYWKGKELVKGILIKKSLLSSNPNYTKPATTYQPAKPPLPAQIANPQPPKQLPIEAREPGKCWGCNEP